MNTGVRAVFESDPDLLAGLHVGDLKGGGIAQLEMALLRQRPPFVDHSVGDADVEAGSVSFQ